MQEFTQAIGWLAAHPLVSEWYTAVARLLFPILSALILIRAIRSLLRLPHTPEVLGAAEPAQWQRHPPDPLGKYSRPGQIRRCAAELPQHLPAARSPVPGG